MIKSPGKRVSGISSSLALLVLLGVASASCSPGDRQIAKTEYAPALARVQDTDTRGARGTMKGDFEWAAASTSLTEAEQRWADFLGKYRPPDGEYEDAFAAMHVQAAELELLRVEYLLGKRAEGDARLREMDPLEMGDEEEGSSGE